jgi:hypothetical protein
MPMTPAFWLEFGMERRVGVASGDPGWNLATSRRIGCAKRGIGPGQHTPDRSRSVAPSIGSV